VTQLVPALAGLARLLADDEPDESAELVDRALAFGTGFGYGAALLASAALSIGRGDGLPALHSATEAELLARKPGDSATLAEALELQARAHLLLVPDDRRALSLVEAAEAIWRELGNQHGVNRVASIRDLSGQTLPGLFIQTLGGFRVLRRGEPVPVTAW